jgi:hypothetical protein
MMIAILARMFQPAPVSAATAPKPKGLARFDDADRAELDALPRRLRKAIIADRKARVTAALVRFNAGGGRA